VVTAPSARQGVDAFLVGAGEVGIGVDVQPADEQAVELEDIAEPTSLV
jgi:hypothetical protein